MRSGKKASNTASTVGGGVRVDLLPGFETVDHVFGDREVPAVKQFGDAGEVARCGGEAVRRNWIRSRALSRATPSFSFVSPSIFWTSAKRTFGLLADRPSRLSSAHASPQFGLTSPAPGQLRAVQRDRRFRCRVVISSSKSMAVSRFWANAMSIFSWAAAFTSSSVS